MDWGGVGALVGKRGGLGLDDMPSAPGLGEGGGGLSMDNPTGPPPLDGLGLRDRLICFLRGRSGGLPSSCLGYLVSHLEDLIELDLLMSEPEGGGEGVSSPLPSPNANPPSPS